MQDGSHSDSHAQCKIAGSATCPGDIERLSYASVQHHLEEYHSITLRTIAGSSHARCAWEGCGAIIISYNMGTHVGRQHLLMEKISCPWCKVIFKRESACQRHINEQHDPNYRLRESKSLLSLRITLYKSLAMIHFTFQLESYCPSQSIALTVLQRSHTALGCERGPNR